MSTIPQPYPIEHVPEEGPVGVRRWRIYDSTEDMATVGYEFHLNPNKMTSLARERALSVSHTTAPDGRWLITEGEKQAKPWSFGGVILTRDHFRQFDWWFNIRPLSLVFIYDHYGRQIQFMPQHFDAVPPEGRRKNYWRHDYTVSGLVLAVLPEQFYPVGS